MLKLKTHIKFKYINDQQNEEKLDLKFQNSIASMTAHSIDEVQTLVDKATYYHQQGYYVVMTLPYESAPAFDETLEVHKADGHYGSMQVYDQPVAQFDYDVKNDDTDENMDWQTTNSDAELAHHIHTIQDEIRLGNTYQVNYTTRLTAQSIQDGYAYFKSLTADSHGDYEAYIEHDDETIISISPELFFQFGRHQHLEHTLLTKPMKGTIARGGSLTEDEENLTTLKHSKKDRAENVMIVDLLRNDLSKISKVGTVETIDLFKIEKYKTVYQMTSTVRSQLKDRLSLFNVLQALFPCGSITGAPKESTMRIIKNLEKTARGIYCGAIGLLLPDGRMIFNVPIRTIHNNEKRAIYGVGSGITIDSNAEAEIEEFNMKTKILEKRKVNLIETMRIQDGRVQRRREHTERISKSAEALQIPIELKKWDNILDETEKSHIDRPYKLRIELTHEGEFNVDTTALVDSTKPLTAKLKQAQPVSSIYIKNKTTERHHFKHEHETDVVLYYNDKNEITEFDIGNVVIKDGESFITPPYNEQILNGCMRQQLLASGVIKEQAIDKETLLNNIKNHKYEVFMINSLREWTKIDLKF
ncbi:aminodeoxychorismate synthase component I [Mammaliicoccus vitulinus]|uniref:aminodeoxychorismate synthase component I n=1 Tax=Mammaliicoccus vitulinus TaxID=71237 RepID=UPI002174E85B|nr:aminodeoxychorismate synthase component I [Mammaliicoccus vitulinus]